jgi:hypothetical protein
MKQKQTATPGKYYPYIPKGIKTPKINAKIQPKLQFSN